MIGDADGFVRCAAGRKRTRFDAFVEDYRNRPRGDARRPHRGACLAHLVASTATLLGLLQHVTWMQRVWFQQCVGGTSRRELGLVLNPAESFQLNDGDTLASVTAAHREACATARRVVADLPLDAGVTGHRAGPRTLRWVYLQVLRELAHHSGHADILHEETCRLSYETKFSDLEPQAPESATVPAHPSIRKLLPNREYDDDLNARLANESGSRSSAVTADGRVRVRPCLTSASTIVLMPSGAANFEIIAGRFTGPLVDELPQRAYWERQALVEAAMNLDWRFNHEQQLEGEGGAIELTFERSR